MIICYDIDGTLCTNTNGAYESARPYPGMVAQVNAHYAAGHHIILFTARGSTTGIDWRAFTERQLAEWGVRYHELRFGKPHADLYFDDKTINPWLNPGRTELGIAPPPLPEPLPGTMEIASTSSLTNHPGFAGAAPPSPTPPSALSTAGGPTEAPPPTDQPAPLSPTANGAAVPRIWAIIPARGGSKSIPRKSIHPLRGYPLLAWAIAAAGTSRYITRTFVSTDDEGIAHLGRNFGAEVPFLRPAELATDAAPDHGFVRHALAWFQDHGEGLPDLLVHLRPTTPLRDPAVVDQAIELMLAHPEATSLRSAHPAPESPFKWFRRTDEGYFRSLRDDLSNEAINAPRQQFPAAYIPDGYVDILRPAYFLATDELYGPAMLAFVSPPCLEVDGPETLPYLEFDLSRQPSPLWNWLIRFPPIAT